MPSQIALQLYTVREFTQTADALGRTLARAKKIGYDAVQVSAIGPIEPQTVADILKNEGLTCCATHTGFDEMRDKTDAVIARHKLWGCQYAAIGGTNYKDASLAAWTQFIADYNAIAKKFAGTGVRLGYHNHAHELMRFEGKTALQRMFEGLSPEVWMEIDVYWIAKAGGDPAAFIDQWKGRVPCVHMKDMGYVEGGGQPMREVGEGNLNWPRIIESCRAAGVEWYIVEQDNCNGLDPFDCIERSLKNLKAMGLR